jgi:hypothetical protein
MALKKIPRGLKIWFIIHFIVDIALAIPLIFFPKIFLGLLGFPIVETLTARLVGAALIGIGGASLFAYNKKIETYNILLTLKFYGLLAQSSLSFYPY